MTLHSQITPSVRNQDAYRSIHFYGFKLQTYTPEESRALENLYLNGWPTRPGDGMAQARKTELRDIRQRKNKPAKKAPEAEAQPDDLIVERIKDLMRDNRERTVNDIATALRIQHDQIYNNARRMAYGGWLTSSGANVGPAIYQWIGKPRANPYAARDASREEKQAEALRQRRADYSVGPARYQPRARTTRPFLRVFSSTARQPCAADASNAIRYWCSFPTAVARCWWPPMWPRAGWTLKGSKP